MAHGKETPRQKMIGMMYLVLTAMLALNVSKEVLNAFILVDEGLVTTTENFAAKNATLYNTFAKEAALNPEKVGDWKNMADEVQIRSNELYNFIHDCKIEILSVSDPKSVHENDFHWDEVQAKGDMDVPAEIMVVKGRATELKNKIIEHRDFLVSLINDTATYSGTVHAVEGILTTELPDIQLEHGTSGKKVEPTWETMYFEQIPLASVITLLSNFQANVRNAEAEMIKFLLGQVVAGDLGVNALEAVVMTKRSVVFPGEEYEAQVFLAAYDSTNTPEVVLTDGTTLDTEGGKGIFKTTYGSIGVQTWGGVIKLTNGGQVIEEPFEASVEVAQANATVSATAMNVFYRGLSNPVAVSAGNVAESSVRVSINSPHNIRPNANGSYTVKPGPQGNKATVSVYADIDGASKLMTRMDFRVLDLPTPTAQISGSKFGRANLSVPQLTQLDKVEAFAENFQFEVDFEVTSFTIGFTDASGKWSETKSSGENFTSDMKNIFRRMKNGQRISIENIKCSGPDGRIRTLSPINITVR